MTGSHSDPACCLRDGRGIAGWSFTDNRRIKLMRKLRDYDAELLALNDKAKQLRTRKLTQLGELVIATGADALGTEVLAGVLLAAIGNDDPSRKEAWRKRGAAFFQGRTNTRRSAGKDTGGSQASDPDAQPAAGTAGTA
ncbi:MAG: conjugal transfer protein TraD [Blastomonas fulva]